MATDSTKSRSKKDKKEQRSSFRDILRGVEEGDPPQEKVKFGQEILYLDAWYKKLQYDWFCKMLGSGMNLHLRSNYMLREIFELPPPLPAFDPASSSKISKSERVRIESILKKKILCSCPQLMIDADIYETHCIYNFFFFRTLLINSLSN